MRALTNILLGSDEGLSRGERELIGAFVSNLNDCFICSNVHSRVAQCHLGLDDQYLEQVLTDFQQSELSGKMKALLSIAASVQRGGIYVTTEQITKAKTLGATDLEIHDTVLITGLFCLFNRYVDGLGLESSDTPATFRERGQAIAQHGYGH